jgi:hypothetical protein
MQPDNIEWFIDDEAFSPSYNFAPSSPSPPPLLPVSPTHRKTEKERRLADGRRGEGVGRSQAYDGERA